jgi:large subunit ribosomal protein L21
MYAIIADSGRQFRVEPGQILDIDYRDASTTDDTLTFDRVLAVGSDQGLRLGTPTVAGASVTAKVLGVEKGDKIYIQKFRRRKNYDRRTGHRQLYTRVRIDSING